MKCWVTNFPIISGDLTEVLPVCHSKAQAFDYINNRFLARAKTQMKWSSMAKKHDTEKVKRRKRCEICAKIKEKGGLFYEPEKLVEGNIYTRGR